MNNDAKLRPLYLARILYERTDEDNYLTTAQLIEILEKEYDIKTHRQTIPSDIDILRAFGMDIQEVMSAQKRYNLISREYDIAELKLMIDAVESSKFITKKKSQSFQRWRVGTKLRILSGIYRWRTVSSMITRAFF